MIDLLKKTLLKFWILMALFGVVFGLVNNANAYVSVKGHYKSNGTYVAPYVRSNPNGIKYDNYSYKPSQGLYNKTYGTRGVTWDTPTYITDPQYYQGKSLYDSKQGGYTTYIPSYPTSSNPPSSYMPPANSFVSSAAVVNTNKPIQKIPANIKQFIDNNPNASCYSAGFSDNQIADCFRYSLNKDNFNWETSGNETVLTHTPTLVSQTAPPVPTQLVGKRIRYQVKNQYDTTKSCGNLSGKDYEECMDYAWNPQLSWSSY